MANGRQPSGHLSALVSDVCEVWECQDIENEPEIVGRRGQAELGANLLQPSHQKRTLVHPLFDRAKLVFAGLEELVEYERPSSRVPPQLDRWYYRGVAGGPWLAISLVDRPTAGRDPTITAKARTWLVAWPARNRRRWAIPTSCGRRGCWPRMPVIRGPPPAIPVWQTAARDGLQDPRRARGQTASGALLPREGRSGIRAQDGGSLVRLSPTRGAA